MAATWKQHLDGKLPSDWAAEIDSFEAQMLLRKQAKVEEKVFAELRLRRIDPRWAREERLVCRVRSW